MPNDLESAFAALAEDANRQARLAPAATLRKRADRRTLTRSLAGVAVAVALTAGLLVGSRLVLTDNALPPVPPSQSTAPTTAPPSVAPSPPARPVPSSPPASADSPAGPGTAGSHTPVIPRSIPDRAFLRGADTNGGKPERRDGGKEVPRTLCGRSDFGSEDQVGIRGAIDVHYEDGRPEYTPLYDVRELITVYRGDGAEALLDETRAELRNCPAGGDGVTYRSLGSTGLGDESILVRGASPARGDDGELSPDGGTHYRYLARIRVGDTVVELAVTGYESQSVERADADALCRRAVQRLTNWRG